MPAAASSISHQYAADVVSGKVAACQWVKLACERHFMDLKDGHLRGLEYNEHMAQLAINFFGLLTLFEGEWAGHTFTPQPWQQFIIASMYGWYKVNEDGERVRRFNTAYVEIPRKNGKTTLSGGVGLYMFVMDGEAAPQVYYGAAKRDQARIGFSAAIEFIKASPPLSGRLHFGRGKTPPAIYYANGKPGHIKPLSADNKKSGLNPSGAVIDELHEHPDSTTVDLITTGMSARKQPMMFVITTSGSSPAGVCYEYNEYTKKVLQGVFNDDSWFGIIYTVDDPEDWKNPDQWIIANPNLGHGKTWDAMKKSAHTASQMIAKQNAFKRLELNIWTTAHTSWISDDKWRGCGADFTDDIFKSGVCFGGLDLAPASDFSSLCLLTLGPDACVYARWWYWIPEDNLTSLSEEGKHDYWIWQQQGHLETTPGDVTDFEYIQTRIEQICQQYQVQTIGFDKAYAFQLANSLIGKGIKMQEYSQSRLAISPPARELERLIISKKLKHQSDPVTRWMLTNVEVEELDNDLIKIYRKGPRSKKIDGIIAAIIAQGIRMSVPAPKASYYNRTDIVT